MNPNAPYAVALALEKQFAEPVSVLRGNGLVYFSEGTFYAAVSQTTSFTPKEMLRAAFGALKAFREANPAHKVKRKIDDE